MDDDQFPQFVEINHGEHVVVSIRVIGGSQLHALRQQHREIRRFRDRKIAQIYGNPFLRRKNLLHLLLRSLPEVHSVRFVRRHETVEGVSLHLQHHGEHVHRNHPEVPPNSLQFRGKKHVLAEVGDQSEGDRIVQNPGDFGQKGGVQHALVAEREQQRRVLDHFETLVRDETPVWGGKGGEIEEEEGHGVDLVEEEGGEAGMRGGIGGTIGVATRRRQRGIEQVHGE